jgi:hypothetical protein
MTIQKAYDTYEVFDTFQGQEVKGTLSIDTKGFKTIYLSIRNDDPIVQMNYSEENGNILIQGKELLIPFSKYVGDNIQEILNSVQ